MVRVRVRVRVKVKVKVGLGQALCCEVVPFLQQPQFQRSTPDLRRFLVLPFELQHMINSSTHRDQ